MVVTLIIGMIPTVAFADTDCNHIYENGECIICHEDATSNLESKFNFEISKDKIHPGEEFTVVISSVEAIAKAESITNLQNELDYDKDKVEYISSELNVDPLYIELGIYVQDHRHADYCVAFSRTSTNSSAFDVSVGNMLTVTFKAKTELLVDEASKCKREGCNYTEGTTTEAKVKADAKTEVATYKNADDYRDAQKAELKAVIDKAADSIEAAKSEAEVKAAVAEAKVAIDAIKTKNDVIVDSNDSSKDVLDETTKEIVDAATKNPETVTNVDKAVVDAVKEAVEDGETVTTTTAIEVTSIDKKDAENVFGKKHVTLVEKEVGRGTIAQYFDLEVILKVFANGNQTAEGNITKLEKPITFTIDIPDALKRLQKEWKEHIS